MSEKLKIFITCGTHVFVVLLFLCSCQEEENPSPAGDPGVIAVSLNIHLQYPGPVSFDSAYVVFKNSTTEIKQRLILDNSAHIASASITDFPRGPWKVSTSYFSTIIENHESLENNGVTDLLITPTTTDIISDEAGVYVKDGNAPVPKSFKWVDYYYYQVSLNNKPEGFIRLPKDPGNPFIQIATFTPRWIYAYADRSFINRSSDGTSNHLQGSGAFEIYGEGGDTHDRLDRDIIDSTSFAPVITGVRDKEWNLVDCIIILYDDNDNEILFYHVWDLRIPGGRVKSGLQPGKWSKYENAIRKN
jgi:hypothetical protein